ncbi:PilZ domain-containing protein [Sphingomonas sp.]|uniref:PilZ domain-containing protein n=1 Tax=Sphingomonas sp. TaxID=28214 RepID=UPI001EB3C704|nr:PilZ domain-containing protein [Sphingomonas sp.]MBX3595528.1 PilZ domain-containing protein [Sphingomonas sp.]
MDQFSTDPFHHAPSDDPASQRGTARDSLLLAAMLKVAGGEAVQVRVRNLSAGGLMAEYAERVEIGTPVQVDVRGVGWVDGRIAWATDGRIGIAFDHDIDPMAARKPVTTKPASLEKPPVRRPI